MKLKENEDIELETNNLLNLLQHAANEATPNSDPQRPTNNIPYLYPKREEPGQSGKELTHQTAEENITEKTTNLNPNSKKGGMNPLKNTFLIINGKITLFGNL